MTDSWNSLEGVTFGDKFQLQNLLASDGHRACFLARVAGPSPRVGRLWLALADDPANDRQLEFWKAAAGLSHPNLVEAWEAGRGERGVTPLAYLWMEPADENLGAVLRERPLNQVEAREALRCAAHALRYLHSRNLVHGKLEPSAILAVGDAIKLSCDTVQPPREISAADDLRALGDCVHAMLTQRLETDLDHLSILPQPFRDIVRGCYGANGGEQWTAQRILTVLEDPPAAADPAIEPVAPETAESAAEQPPHILPLESAEPDAKERIRIPAWAVALVACLGVVFMMALLARKPQPVIPPPARPAVPPSIISAPPSLPPAAAPAAAPPAAQPPASRTEPSRIWRVVTYTYSTAEDAARMVVQINRRYPQLKAERFFPNGSEPPYYVALGGRMTRTEAVRLRERAISSGLPRDTFVRNFKK